MSLTLAPALPVTLGTNTFGWTNDTNEAHMVLDAFVAAGGTHIDTADVYPLWVDGATGRESETIIGQWLSARGNRDDVFIATKVAKHPENPGLSRDNVYASVDASLRRLGTDHIDLYYAHEDDESQSPDQLAATFGALVETGKVRHIGMSQVSAPRQQAWIDAARSLGVAAPTASQPHYSLVFRDDVEGAVGDVARANSLTIFDYFPLASGLLTGKYRSADDFVGTHREGRLAELSSDGAFTIVDTLIDVARQRGTEPAAVALAWLVAQDTVPIASARTTQQLAAITAVGDVRLTADEITRLDEVSAPRR